MSKQNNGFSYKDGISLKEYFDTRLCDVLKASDLASKNLDNRLEHLNEFRQAMQDQSKTYLTREAYESKHQLLENKIDTLQKFMYMMMGGLVIIEIALRFLKL